MNSNKLRILLLAPSSNPNSLTGPLIGYSLGAALARVHTVTLVIESRNETAVRNGNGGFHSIESVPPSKLDPLYAWAFRHIFKEDRGNILWTAVRFPLAIFFEIRAWKRLKRRIYGGEFDVALRILPIVPTMPSPFAFFLRKGPIPFVLGPLNGGLPWPKGFSQLERQRKEPGNWIAGFRNLYRLLPFARSTYARATAIIAGSTNTFTEFSHYQTKLFYIPGENGVNPSWIQERPPTSAPKTGKLDMVIVNRLVPLKAVDLALRGAASLLRAGKATLKIIGDGPERQRLENLVDELKVRDSVTFCGVRPHADTLVDFANADIMLFPSLREFGGGVVFEALAKGAVPIVADFGGPGDIVTEEVGYRIPMTDEHKMAADIETILKRLDSDRNHLETLSRRCASYVRDNLTWDAKARMVTQVLRWAVGGGQKPNMPPPPRSAPIT